MDTQVLPKTFGGRYALGSEVVRLRTGSIYQAQDSKDGSPLLVHCVAAPDREHSALRQQARMVAQRLASLNHRNLPRVIDVVEDGQFVYSLQEEFAGISLATLPVPIEAELLIRYLQQILQALEYLHGQSPPMIHRDLRPETVLIAPHGTLQVIGEDVASIGTGSLHEALQGLATSEFAAPEQVQGAHPHPAQDLYSAGALAHYMATGKAPKPGHESQELDDLPESLRQVVSQLLSLDPEKRPNARVALSMLPTRQSLPGFLEVAQTTPEEKSVSEVTAQTSPKAQPGKVSMWQVLFRRRKRAKAASNVPDDSGAEVELIRQSYPLVDLTEQDLDPSLAQLLPEAAARSIAGVCIGVSGRDLIVAVKDPSLVYIYDHVSYATQGRYRAVLRRADPTWIDRALEWAYRSRSKTSWRSWVQRRALDNVALHISNPMADTSILGEEISHPIIEATERMIKESLAVGTSDIHMEAFENRVEIRYRIDGVLQSAVSYPPAHGSAMVKRIKVMANMDISQERIPQGGRISLTLGELKYDLRVSIVPVAHGESVVMRVLKKGSFNLTLSDLGLDPEVEKRYRASLSQPHGMILVCGPTGSGKSTTLYASLKELLRPDRKLLTVEDPVEYEMDGLVQVQVNMSPREEEMRVTFARVLREFLRHDPEVILVGEIRDPETASIALQASLTGHLVLSTLHTNDSIGLVSRLRDMGIKSYLVASTLRCGLSQRLARRNCPSCREEIPVTPELLTDLEREGVVGPYRQFRGRGCRECLDTGYRGRLGIYEILEVDAALRTLLAQEALEADILNHLTSTGFRTLFQNGLEKVIQGSISYEEVQRVCRGH